MSTLQDSLKCCELCQDCVQLRVRALCVSGTLVCHDDTDEVSRSLVASTLCLYIILSLPIFVFSSTSPPPQSDIRESPTMGSPILRVLALPEMVIKITGFLDGDHTALVSCLFVNRTWFEATILTLWNTCGDGMNDAAIPEINDLTRLASTPQRMQKYANCITDLFFSVDTALGLGASVQSEIVKHFTFSGVAFPRLKWVEFGNYAHRDVYMSTTSLQQHYLHARLRSFGAFVLSHGQGELVPDGFFSVLQVQSTPMNPAAFSLWT